MQDDFVRSQLFSLGGHEWSLKVYPEGYSTAKRTSVSVFLSHDCPEPEDSELATAFRISVNGRHVEKDKIVYRYPAHATAMDWGFGAARSLADLGIVDDQMHIELELEVFKEMRNLPSTAAAASSTTRGCDASPDSDALSAPTRLGADLGALLEGDQPPALSDVTFVFGKRERTAAHKAILAARSPVFRSMFTLGMKESTASEVKISEPRLLFQEMLRVIYTGRADPAVLAENTVELLALADKYEVADLRRECESLLLDSATRANAASLLSVADEFRCETLKRKLLEFISENFVDVVQTSDFHEVTLRSPALVGEVHSALVARVSTISQLKPADETTATRPTRRRKRADRL